MNPLPGTKLTRKAKLEKYITNLSNKNSD